MLWAMVWVVCSKWFLSKNWVIWGEMTMWQFGDWLICTYLYYIEPPGIYLKYQSTRLDISMWQPSKLGTWANSWHLDEIRKLLCLPPRYRLLDCRFAHDQSPLASWEYAFCLGNTGSHLLLQTLHYVTSYSSYQCWSVASLSSSHDNYIYIYR